MSELPDGWALATLQELAGPKGLMDDGDWIESKDQDPDGDVRLIQLADIGDGHFFDKSRRFLTSAKATELRCTHLQPGDLLIARMPDPLGRSCIFPDIGMPSVTAVDVCIWRAAPDTIDARWLMHFVNSPEVRDAIQSQASGTTRQRVSGGNLKRLPVPVPPAQEQRRIVAKLDSLRARSSRARQELDHLPKLIERYKQAILAKAFSGELTKDWRDENGLEDGETVTLASVADDFSYGSSSKSSPSGRVPVLRMGNIQDGKLDWTDLVYTSDEAEIEKYRLRSGDVLFNRTNSPELVGKTALFAGDREAIYAGYLVRVRCGERLLPSYLTYCLNSPLGRDYCWQVKTDGVSQSNVNATKLAAFEFILPTAAEQAEIVRRIDHAFAWLDKIATEHARAEHLLPKLDQAILAKAFRGELVPQDPNDEPASVLLARIRGERERVEQPTRRRARSA